MKSQLSLAILFAVLSETQSKSVISNIIVLMMENRSFDHLLGWLKSDFNSKIEGLTDGMRAPRDPDLSKGYVSISRHGYDVAPDDPAHGFDDIAIQINHDKMNGFVFDAIKLGLNESNSVSMFDKKSAPIINTLAMEYALFDHWFCSVPGPTEPNREYATGGFANSDMKNFNGTFWSQQSYFDYLRQHNRTWAGYYQKDTWSMAYYADMNKPENSQYIHELDERFYSDVAAGTLPQFTWLQPQMTTYDDSLCNWQHPDASVMEGERLIKKIYEAIRAGPKWEETLFLITYDEHGGFYDHVAPPKRGVPGDNQNASNGFKYDQLGVRVPTIAISPYIPKGTLVNKPLKGESPTIHSQFESTSILATANKLFGMDAEGIKPMTERMGWSNTFAGLVDLLSEPRTDCPLTLPELPPINPTAYTTQRAKPLNEHMQDQLLFLCVQNYPTEHAAGLCSGRNELMINQGIASDWIKAETLKYRAKLTAAEEVWKQKNYAV